MTAPVPPVAKKAAHTIAHLGHTWDDPYTWLQNKQDPEVIAYLEAENAYAKARLAHTQALQEKLYQEMYGRIKEDDSTYPQQKGGYEYYWRVQAGQQYRLYCRRPAGAADEQILVDENRLAEGHTYCRVFSVAISPDNTRLAYTVDLTGAWVFSLVILDMATGQVLADGIDHVAWSIAWAADSRTLFYSVFNTAHRSARIMRHVVGAGLPDALVHDEQDDSMETSIALTNDGQYLLLKMESMSTTEVHFLDAHQPEGSFSVVEPRRPWHEYYVEHHEGMFYIVSNHEAVNFQVFRAPVSQPSQAHWQVFVPHRDDVLLESVTAYRDYLAFSGRRDGLPALYIVPPHASEQAHFVQFPDPVYHFVPVPPLEYNTSQLRLTYDSLVIPQSTVDYDMASRAWNVRKVQEIPSGFDSSQYISERHYAPAADGALVPISLAYRRGTSLGPQTPLLLYGYGSYGYSLPAAFQQERISLLDAGFVFALAHVRGGSEKGRAWYENGRLMHKKNSFTDFIACAEYLVEKGYTSPRKLCAEGGSAGGLLMSAVVNLRPDLFRAVVALVPFTNLITAILDPDLPLTVIEYEQWGHPQDAAAFDYMRSYSPYDNIEPKAYPHIYAKAGLHDLQVPFWDPAKWVARLRATKTDANDLLLVTNMGAGHSGSSGRYNRLREIAEQYAFLIDKVGES
jgi:oligopeptidase B